MTSDFPRILNRLAIGDVAVQAVLRAFCNGHVRVHFPGRTIDRRIVQMQLTN